MDDYPDLRFSALEGCKAQVQPSPIPQPPPDIPCIPRPAAYRKPVTLCFRSTKDDPHSAFRPRGPYFVRAPAFVTLACAVIFPVRHILLELSSVKMCPKNVLSTKFGTGLFYISDLSKPVSLEIKLFS